MNNKTAQAAADGTIELLRPFKGSALTITADKGSEFSYQEKMTEALEAKAYFAAPYNSWQRGLN